MTLLPEECALPPLGWSCSRTAGHDGPCAASPINTRSFPLSGFSQGTAQWQPTGPSYPTWDSNRRTAIAIQADEFADAYFHRNGIPDPEELDRLLKTLYDLVHGL